MYEPVTKGCTQKWDNALKTQNSKISEFNERTNDYFQKHDRGKITETKPLKRN